MQGLVFHHDSNCKWPLNEALSKKGVFYEKKNGVKRKERKERMGKRKNAISSRKKLEKT